MPQLEGEPHQGMFDTLVVQARVDGSPAAANSSTPPPQEDRAHLWQLRVDPYHKLPIKRLDNTLASIPSDFIDRVRNFPKPSLDEQT